MNDSLKHVATLCTGAVAAIQLLVGCGLPAEEEVASGLIEGVGTSEGGAIEIPDSEADVESQDAYETVSVLELAPGHKVVFSASDDGTKVEEIVPSGSAPISLDANGRLRDFDPLELYLSLTPGDRAIPKALFELSESLTAKQQAAVRALTDNLGSLPGVSRAKDSDVSYRPELCGSSGAIEFQKICDANAGFSQNFCEPQLHPWHARSSRGKKRLAAGIAVSCNASVRTDIKRKFGGIWYTDSFPLDASNYLMITRVKYPYSYYRYVRHTGYNATNTSGNWIRSWIGFH